MHANGSAPFARAGAAATTAPAATTGAPGRAHGERSSLRAEAAAAEPPTATPIGARSPADVDPAGRADAVRRRAGRRAARRPTSLRRVDEPSAHASSAPAPATATAASAAVAVADSSRSPRPSRRRAAGAQPAGGRRHGAGPAALAAAGPPLPCAAPAPGPQGHPHRARGRRVERLQDRPGVLRRRCASSCWWPACCSGTWPTTTGTIANVEGFVRDLFGLKTLQVRRRASSSGRPGCIGAVLVIAGTGLSVTLAVLFNLISDLLGGVRVTVLEEEVIARERPTRSPASARRPAPPASRHGRRRPPPPGSRVRRKRLTAAHAGGYRRRSGAGL